MRVYILFFISLIFSCTRTIVWDTELKDCTFEFHINNENSFIEFDSATKKYLFMKNLDNSSVSYNFICNQTENMFSGEVVSGDYFIACYLLVPKTVGDEKKFYTQSYFVDNFLLSPDSKNKKTFILKEINTPFKDAFYDDKNVGVNIDLSYDFFQIYKISAVSVKNGNKNKSYDYYDDAWYYFNNVSLDDDKIFINLSYSIKNLCSKDFLSNHDVKLTTTRIENLDVFLLIE